MQMSTAPLEALQEGKMGGRAGGKEDTRLTEPVVLGLLGLLVQFFQLLGLKSSIIKHLGSRMDHST